MDQPVDAVLYLDESTEVGQVSDLALQPGARRILAFERFPRIRLELLQSEGDLLVLLVDVQDDGLNGIADRDDL